MSYRKSKIPKPTGRSCPACQIGELMLRKGKFGDFYGCSKYPYCTYKEKAPAFADASARQRSALEMQADEILRRAGCKDLII